MMINGFDRSENIVGKGEMPVTGIFSFFHDVFKMSLFEGY